MFQLNKIHKLTTISLLLELSFFLPLITFAKTKVTTLPIIAVDKSNINLFSTPLAYYQNTLYTVNVESTDSVINNGLNLRTIVRKTEVSSNKGWNWVSKTIDENTIESKYHAQASIGIDKLGYLHIAYGMHNMPWQYVVSDDPGSISSFTFFGDPVSSLEKTMVKHLNKTPFPSKGTAAIPGNQVTYPAFFYDNNNDLYVTYRFATKPKRRFKDRGFSGAISKYNIYSKKWVSLGGNLQITKDDADWPGTKKTSVVNPFAFRDQWAVYLPRLAFDKNNGMHISWLWREGGAGRDTSHPSYAFVPNGETNFYNSQGVKYSLPISVKKAEWIGVPSQEKFDAITDISTYNHFVYIVINKKHKTRELNKLDQKTQKWLKPEIMPFSAPVLKIDKNGGQWSFATGLTVLYRRNDNLKWKIIYKEKTIEKYGYPKVLAIPEKNKFFIHTQSLNQEWVKIYELEY